MALQLQRPLCVFDLETTGLQITKDRIVQIAVIKLKPDGQTETFNELVNPGQPIPAEISAIHGITNEMVASAPTFEELAPRLLAFIGAADLAGYNSNKFDIPVLSEELLRCGIDFDLGARHFVDVQNIFHKMEQRTLAAAYQFYCGKQIENAHNALYDTLATLEVLQAQTEKYADLSNDIAGLAKFSTVGNQQNADFAGRLSLNEQQEVCYNFGKHKGKTVAEVLKLEPGYYGWMLEADFPLYTKQVLRKEMERIKSLNNNQDIEDKLEALKNKFKKP
jgi:DNA polymerase-3 subunit epsilon